MQNNHQLSSTESARAATGNPVSSAITPPLDLVRKEWQHLLPYRTEANVWMVPDARPEVLRVLPWYEGAFPRLILSEPGSGPRRVAALLEWGGHGKAAVTLHSMERPDFERALADVLALAAGYGEDEQVDWGVLANQRTGGRVGRAGVSFENLAATGLPSFICLVHPKGGEQLVSGARPSRREAFENVMQVLTRGQPVPQPGKRPVKALEGIDSFQVSDVWRFEHAWLLGLSKRTTAQEQRLLLLSGYIALADPLRKHEIEPARRDALRRQAGAEIREHLNWSTRNGQDQLQAKMISTWATSSADSTRMAITEQFEGACAAAGMSAAAAVAVLLKAQLIKRAGDELFSLAPMGISLMDRVTRFDGAIVVGLTKCKGETALKGLSRLHSMMDTDPSAFLNSIVGQENFSNPKRKHHKDRP